MENFNKYTIACSDNKEEKENKKIYIYVNFFFMGEEERCLFIRKKENHSIYMQIKGIKSQYIQYKMKKIPKKNNGFA